ncbi:M81 family metallopeptidase [Chloroflexi bacterium TSY]|nr:M81 family metallopeptidase [Chloroflexi bacterium TSY]
MRIAFGGISIENGSFSPLTVTLTDFMIMRGNEMMGSDRYPFLSDFQANSNVEFLPTLFAHTWPGGELEQSAYRTLKEELLERLSIYNAVDGVYLDLHGAMKIVGMDDAEADLARSIRNIVGPDALISASMDLHGNISHDYVEQIDMLTAYRTAPHHDTLETRQRACNLLVHALQMQHRPKIALHPIPVLLSGEQTRTDMEPGNGIWSSLEQITQVPSIIDASLFVGFAWVDEPRARAAAVVTGLDQDVAVQEAAKLAQAYWDARTEFHYGVESGTIDECIGLALAATEPTIFISDSGDNPTAGAAGDIPLFVERLLAYPVSTALVAAIPDAGTVARCKRVGIGAKVNVELGGKLDTVNGTPLPIEGLVVTIEAGDSHVGDQVVLRINQENMTIDVIVTEQRKPFTTVTDFEQVGIHPLDYKIVVVKLGYLFPDLIRVAPRALMALSPGASDLNLARLPYQRIERPMYPIDPSAEVAV